MNNVAGAVMLCLVLLAPMVVYGAYRVLRGVRGGGRIGFGLAAAAALLLLLLAAQVFAGGDAVDGQVLRKSETVQLARLELIPSVLHILRAEVRTDGPSGASLVLALAPATFDRLHEGQAVRLRQTSIGPLRFARLADSPGWSQLPALEFTGLAAVFAGALSLVALGFGVLTPIMGWRGRAAFAALALSAFVLDALATRPWWTPRTSQAQAVLIEAHAVTEAVLRSRTNHRDTEVFRLPKAYDEVTLRLTPSPGADPVTAVDRVDGGSAGPLIAGTTVAVAFDPADPRNARLLTGDRSFALAAYAARFGGLAALGAIAAAALFAAMVYLARRQRAHQGARPTGPTSVTDR